jgi:hypothetical protein
MPATHETPQLTVFRNGRAKLSDQARRALLGKTAVLLSAPSAIGCRWLLLGVEWTGGGASLLYEDRGQKRFTAYALATALFAALPTEQKSIQLALEPAPAGFWLVPAAEGPHKCAQAA